MAGGETDYLDSREKVMLYNKYHTLEEVYLWSIVKQPVSSAWAAMGKLDHLCGRILCRHDCPLGLVEELDVKNTSDGGMIE